MRCTKWDEWCRAYDPECNLIYAYKTVKDSGNAFDARRRVLVAQQRGGTWRSPSKNTPFYGTHVMHARGEIPIFNNYRRANGNIATYNGLENDGGGNVMPTHPVTLMEWIDKLKDDTISRQHTGKYTKFEAVDVFAAYRADINQIRGGLARLNGRSNGGVMD